MANRETSGELFTLELDHRIEFEQDSDAISDVFKSTNTVMSAEDDATDSNAASEIQHVSFLVFKIKT